MTWDESDSYIYMFISLSTGEEEDGSYSFPSSCPMQARFLPSVHPSCANTTHPQIVVSPCSPLAGHRTRPHHGKPLIISRLKEVQQSVIATSNSEWSRSPRLRERARNMLKQECPVNPDLRGEEEEQEQEQERGVDSVLLGILTCCCLYLVRVGEVKALEGAMTSHQRATTEVQLEQHT